VAVVVVEAAVGAVAVVVVEARVRAPVAMVARVRAAVRVPAVVRAAAAALAPAEARAAVRRRLKRFENANPQAQCLGGCYFSHKKGEELSYACWIASLPKSSPPMPPLVARNEAP
jgi:hypothetical protein